MGTGYRVRVAMAPQDGEAEILAAQVAIRALVEEQLDAVDRAMSTYREDSEVSRFNQLGAGQPHAFSEAAWAVLELAWHMREESAGAFDPTVGPLVDAWGFGAPGRADEPAPPTADRLAELQRALGAVELFPEDRRAVKLDAGVALDFSAIAKGWAVDRVSEALAAAGYANHLIEIGGEVRTSGRSPEGNPWRLAIERPPQRQAGPKPVYAAAALQRVLSFNAGSLATSGDYRNYWERDGRRYSHTIDPRTGRPVGHALASASVFHSSCAVADAYATALMVLGPEAGEAWANERGVAALLLVYREDGLEERATAAFRESFGDPP